MSATEIPFTTLDVFTGNRFEGNPVAIVQVPRPLKQNLTQQLRQQIAAEFNLSETVFLHDDETASTQREINIHTVERELPFAGHPTIGTAFLLRCHLNLPVETLKTKAGPIPISFTGGMNRNVRAKIPHDIHIHSKTLGDSTDPQLQSYLSPCDELRLAELRAPLVSIVNGMTFILVELPSLELLARAHKPSLNLEAISTPLLDPGWAPSFVARYFYVKTGSQDGTQIEKFRARMMELSFEDPATGSAACTLAGYLTLTKFSNGAHFEVTQGVEICRKSTISVQTTGRQDDNGVNKVDELWLGGEAIVVSNGSISI